MVVGNINGGGSAQASLMSVNSALGGGEEQQGGGMEVDSDNIASNDYCSSDCRCETRVKWYCAPPSLLPQTRELKNEVMTDR